MKLTRRSVLAAPFLALQSKAQTRRPNVVMFMTDDHGAWANGTYGCAEVQTPNIDALASGGAKFTRAYACTPVCSPSRLTYMTGRLPSTHTVEDWLRPVDSFGDKSRMWLDGQTTNAEILAKNGYRLGMSGKWHMGHDEKAQFGFSYWATVPGGGGTYKNPEFVKNGERFTYEGFKTDAVGDYAVEFIDQQSADQPFYLLVPFYAPHTPLDYQPDQYREPYKDSQFSCFPKTERHPWQNNGLKNHHGNKSSMLGYSALITAADHQVGRVLKKLEEKGLRDNTLVVFTADQGWNAGHHGVWGKGNGTWPFNMYEESIRVPMIWNHPARIKPGQTLTPMVSSYDYFPTILDYLGVQAPADRKRIGRSYAGFLTGRNPRWNNRLYFEYSMVRAVRTETMKYIERTKEWESELYDLEHDPGETKNLINSPDHRKQRETLKADLGRFFQSSGAPALEDWRSVVKQELTEYERAK